MVVEYNIILIILSILVAIMGSFTGLILTSGTSWLIDYSPKLQILKGAIAIGGSIWSMHFIGMLAFKLPIIIHYDVLLTIVSAFTAMIMTGLGLYICNYVSANRWGLIIGGLFMGLGITSMHFTGMSAIRGNCIISYSSVGIFLSVLIAVVVSAGALKFAFREKAMKEISIAAVVLGISISSMHYVGMFSTSFILKDDATDLVQSPVFSSDIMGVAVALTSFFFCGLFLLMALPEKSLDEQQHLNSFSANDSSSFNHFSKKKEMKRIPVKKNGATVYLHPTNITHVAADGHYTVINDLNDEYYCDHSISKIEKKVAGAGIVRCHRSFLVNLNHVKAIIKDGDRGFLLMGQPTETEVPVSRSKLEIITQMLEKVDLEKSYT